MSEQKTNAEKSGAKVSSRTTETLAAGHIPVFLQPILESFKTATGPVRAILDGTFGRGGHTRELLAAYPEAKVVAFDWDEDAIKFGRETFAAEIAAGRLHLCHASYSEFLSTLAAHPELPRHYDLMMLDLGVSSPQLDRAERGFSFYHDGPLDMRMDARGETTAATIVNEWEEQDIARLFIEYGEISRPFRVVRAIVNDRKVRKPFETTRELASMIERVDGWQKKGSHPATRYFLALRMKVNEELNNLTDSIPKLISGLSEGGVLSIITFHSLEDRIVKNVFKEQLEHGRLVNKKVVKPTEVEVRENSRARSAKLRAFQKIDQMSSQDGQTKQKW